MSNDLLRDCFNYLYNYVTFVTNIKLLPDLTVGGLMLAVCSFVVVLRLIIIPLFQTDSSMSSGSGKGK